MKIYKDNNVVQEATARIEWLFDQYEGCPKVVNISGGKDSIVVWNLVNEVAKKRGEKIYCLWLDQEAEWSATVKSVKYMMTDPNVIPLWLQMPFVMENASSNTKFWYKLWGIGEEHMREKDPIALKELSDIEGWKADFDYYDALNKAPSLLFPNQRTLLFGGLRSEESPQRHMTVTTAPKYKWVTWARTNDDLHYVYYPVYDWSYIDVWKYIHENELEYPDIYDKMYAYGEQIQNLRVSSLIHAVAIRSLFIVQELEPETYTALTKRFTGISTASQLGKDDFGVPSELPFMFSSWEEYRDYLLDNLIGKEVGKAHGGKLKSTHSIIKNGFDKLDFWGLTDYAKDYYKTCIETILYNDIDLVKVKQWQSSIGFKIGNKMYNVIKNQAKMEYNEKKETTK